MSATGTSANDSSLRTPLVAAAISGFVYFLGLFVPQVDGPDVETATAAQIRTFLAAHDSDLRIGAAAAIVAILAVLVFATSLARLIRASRPGSQLADLVVCGGVLVAVWHWVVVTGSSTTLVQRLDGYDLARVDDATLRGWYGLSNFTHLFADLGMAGMVTVMAAASIAILRACFVARWLGWAGIVLAAGGAIGTIGVMAAVRGLADVWFVGIFGWWLWILAVAIGCTVRLRRGRSRVAGAAPQAAAVP
jgi:hypothetical protein